MIETIQANKSFYFSFRLDLTKTMQNVLQELTQQADQTQKTATGLPDLARLFPNSVDYITKFAFNHAMLTEFSEV